MQWIEVKVTFASDDEDLTAELIGDLFQNLGTNGVVVDDPRLEPSEGWGSDAVARPAQSAVTGYLPSDERLESRCRDLEKSLADLSAQHAFQYTVGYHSIDEEDWAESWKAFFYPEEITERLVVKPTWRDYTAQPHQQVIEIDPGMAFGTGTHPTTALCVRMLETYVQPGHAVLDVGTGSGILLIAAAKLGAGQLTGVDLDPVAVGVARANLLQNQIAPEQFTLSCAELTQGVARQFDIVVANILADVIIDLLDQVTTVLVPGGVFICSGIIQAYRDKILRKMALRGFSILDVLDRGEWVAAAGRLQ